MLTAKQVAELLNLSVRTVYGLPIPNYRFGSAVRWELDDVESYKQSCRVNVTKVSRGGVINLKSKLADADSELMKYFKENLPQSKPRNSAVKKKSG